MKRMKKRRSSGQGLSSTSTRLSFLGPVGRYLSPAAFLAALLTAGLSPQGASAATLDWSDPAIDWLPGNNAPNGLTAGQDFQVATAGGGTVTVRFVWATAAGTFEVLDDPEVDPNPAAGGFDGGLGDLLNIQFDPATVAETRDLTIQFLDQAGNPITLDDARFIIADIDDDNLDLWIDQITFSGSLAGAPVSLTGFATEDGTATGARSDTVNFLGEPFTTATVTGTSITAFGVDDVNEGDAPGISPDEEADNRFPEGNLGIDFNAPLDTVQFQFGNGPGSPANPGQHGVGLFNVVFDAAIIGVGKSVGTPVANANGSFTVPYLVRVDNPGDVPLNNVALIDDLRETYGTAANSFSIEAGSVADASGEFAGATALTVNAGYDGRDNNNLLTDTGNTLPVGGFGAVRFNVVVNPANIDLGTVTLSPPATTSGPFNNQITARGTSPSGATVEDLSTDDPNFDNPNGPDSDPNDDGSYDESVPTPVSFNVVPVPRIGVAKQAVSVVEQPTGQFGATTVRVTYDIRVENIGTEALEDVQLVEDLDNTFGANSFAVFSLTRTAGATTVDPNGAFTGTGGNTLLTAAGGTLAVNASTTLRLVIDVDSTATTPAAPGPYDNQVSASATGSDSGDPSNVDDSDSGVEVDPDGDGDPGEEDSPPDPDNPDNDGNENTPTRVRFSPNLNLVKRITAVTRNGAAVPVTGIGTFNNDPSDGDDDLLASLSGNSLPVGVFTVPDTLESGDVVEYTVYFYNNGIGTVEDLELCDELQPPSVLIPGSLQLATPVDLNPAGTTLGFGASGILSPRAPLSALADSCQSAPGTFPSGTPTGGLGVGAGGGVVVGGTTPALDVGSGTVGAFRFEITLP